MAVHSCHRHFGQLTQTHIGWIMEKLLKMYLFIMARPRGNQDRVLHIGKS